MNRTRHILASIGAILLPSGAIGCTTPSEPAFVQFELGGSSNLSPAMVRLVGGPRNEVVLDGGAFHTLFGGQRSDSIPLAAATNWPLRVAVVSSTGDTIGSATTTINVEAAKVTTVALVVLSTRVGVFFCAPILTRIPLALTGATQDTLWVASWGPMAEDQHPPVC